MKSFNEWLQIKEKIFLGLGKTTKKPPETPKEPEGPKRRQKFLGLGKTTKKPKN